LHFVARYIPRRALLLRRTSSSDEATVTASISQAQLRAKLREHFGFRKFRPGQAEAVQAALEGRDTLVLMPTGSGKSLCFQLPALELHGMTIVVSPLIALMKDQVDQLRQKGIAAQEFNSSLTAVQRREAEEKIAGGQVEFVYTTPEQIAAPAFRQLFKDRVIDLFVVDEAHCASQWGHDFRPDYLALGEAIAELGRPPVLALTATSTDDVLDDIRMQLRIPDAEIIHTGFYRPNLSFAVMPAAGDAEKQSRLAELLDETEGLGIIYCSTVKAVEQLTEWLHGRGIAVAGYHGKMASKKRHEAQDAFMTGSVRAMVATNAFGLGIDKPDIRFVVHYHLPGTIEAFYQECGRAGRDGATARCSLLYDPEDRKLQRFFQANRYPDEGDLVNLHHALVRLAEQKKPPTLKEIEAISPLAKSKLKVALGLLVNRRIVAVARGSRYQLLRPDLTREQLARAGQSYRERQERDQLKQQQMVQYAESRACRWRTILDYFSSDELEEGRCGQCDLCGSVPAAPGLARASA
jgi:ATP-dependent DNA helicase RecQ